MRYSRVGKRVILGYYDHHANTVEINKYAMELWNTEQIREVIQHELIHTRCYQDFGHGGHGKKFQILAKMLDIPDHVRIATKKSEDWENMQKQKQTYAFDVDGHTVVEGDYKPKERKATTPGWMEQALNEGDGVYNPWVKN
jgi:predicted SprT family Zn-dependent metalloprotease